MRINILIFCLLAFAQKVVSQNFDSSVMRKLANTQPLPFKEANGEYLGCGYRAECLPMYVIFYQTYFNKTSRTLTLKGRLIDPASSKTDTFGVFSFIFVAQPYGEGFKNVRYLKPSYTPDSGAKQGSQFPYRTGDFFIDIKFDKDDRLYFDSGGYDPVEYNIGKLLEASDQSAKATGKLKRVKSSGEFDPNVFKSQ